MTSPDSIENDLVHPSDALLQPVHRNYLMQKLDLHDRGELIKYAIQKKIIEI